MLKQALSAIPTKRLSNSAMGRDVGRSTGASAMESIGVRHTCHSR
jgi:hypothetical protein